MFEGIESAPKHFVLPDIDKEKSEFDRVAIKYGLDSETLQFLASEEGSSQDLSNEIWEKLDNTDSNLIKEGDWNAVQEYSNSANRDWLDLKQKIEKGVQVDAPIIIKYGKEYHLVTGNTRLMVARALGIVPQVLIFEYVHDRTKEE